MVATGSVQLSQGRQSARCERAVYDRVRETLVCAGKAVFRDGDNELAGEEIAIDMRNEQVKVTGGAKVLIAAETLREGGAAGEAAP